MKKRNKLIVIIVCVSLCVAYFGYVAYNIIIPPDAVALIEHKAAYTRVANLCYYDYLLSNNAGDTKDYFMYYLSSKSLYYQSTNYALILNDNDISSIQEVNDTFSLNSKSLEVIRVEKNFVSFCTVNGMDSYIYSLNNDRPNFVNRSDDNFKKIHVQKVADHWYYAYVIQQY